MSDEEHSPIPEIDTTEATGYEWLNRFMQAQAGVAANCLFLAFKLGQIGVAARYDKPMAREMLKDLKTDRADQEFADAELLKVVDGLIANIERGLEDSGTGG